MSADHWAICPQCQIKNTEEGEKLTQHLESQYGKIPLEEYKELEAATAHRLLVISNKAYTLREDYDIGILNGEFIVNYTSHCGICEFSYGYKYVEYPLKTNKKEKS